MQKKLFLLFLSLFLGVFIISGCSLRKEHVSENKDSWEDDVLMAKECGMDGLRCCTEDPACYYGQICCTSPDGTNKNYCADSCDFGTQNNFCRSDDPMCDEGFVCSDSYCLECGGENKLCCEDNLCHDDLVCHNNKCVPCGLPGNPCCDGSCSENSRMECVNNICQECGFGGKNICQNKPFCNPGHLENNKLCLECGKLNLPCCDIEVGDMEACADGLICQKGFCSKK